MTIHERLYALAATSEPDSARELTACADAARDMLEALRALLFNKDHGNGLEAHYQAWDRARAAIAKARGEG